MEEGDPMDGTLQNLNNILNLNGEHEKSMYSNLSLT